MKKTLKPIAIGMAIFTLLVVISRVIVLLCTGFSFQTSLQHAATPLGTPIFWKFSLGLVILIALFAYSSSFLKSFKNAYKYKALMIVLAICGLAVLFWQTNQWYVRNDQKNEYNYKVPTFSSKSQKIRTSKNETIKGASVFGWEEVTMASFEHMKKLGITSVAIMPFEYQIAADRPSISHIDDKNGLRLKDSTFIKLTALCKAQQLTVMLKPHLWIESGWRDKISFETKEEWDMWFSDYSKILLNYAQVAEIGGADILCIGTELLDSIKQQPEKWKELIMEIRKIYSGKLTYAANWDEEYQAVPFWDALDYIGIQAYYPMDVEGDATAKNLSRALRPYLDTLSQVSRKLDKKVIFTEMGYRSIVNNYRKPWAWPTNWDAMTRVYSEKSQATAYEALFSSVFGQDWFAGGFIWEYDFHEDNGPQALQRYNFSPRHKKATEKVIQDYYIE